MPSAPVCSACNAPNRPNARFSAACGAPITDSSTAAVTATTGTAPSQLGAPVSLPKLSPRPIQTGDFRYDLSHLPPGREAALLEELNKHDVAYAFDANGHLEVASNGPPVIEAFFAER